MNRSDITVYGMGWCGKECYVEMSSGDGDGDGKELHLGVVRRAADTLHAHFEFALQHEHEPRVRVAALQEQRAAPHPSDKPTSMSRVKSSQLSHTNRHTRRICILQLSVCCPLEGLVQFTSFKFKLWSFNSNYSTGQYSIL